MSQIMFTKNQQNKSILKQPERASLQIETQLKISDLLNKNPQYSYSSNNQNKENINSQNKLKKITKIEIPVQLRKQFLNTILKNKQPKNQIQLPETNKQYTLILDLDNTLISQYQKDDKIKILERPYLKEFLTQVSKDFEIIIFTSAEKDYADQILNKIDPYNNFFSYKLYRENMDMEQKVKDLEIITNRKLEQILIVDDIPQNFSKQPQNGYQIPPFDVQQEGFISNDKELLKLMYVLDEIMETKPSDIREILKFSDEIIEKKLFEQAKIQTQKFQNLKIQDTKNNDNFKIGALQIQIETPPSDCSSVFSNCSPDNIQGQPMVSVKCHTLANNLVLPQNIERNEQNQFIAKFENKNINNSRKRIESLVTASQRTSENSNFSISNEEYINNNVYNSQFSVAKI